jgi:hypothetical protein
LCINIRQRQKSSKKFTTHFNFTRFKKLVYKIIHIGYPFSARILVIKKNIRKGGRREERDGRNEANACGAKSYVSDLIEKGESNSMFEIRKTQPQRVI